MTNTTDTFIASLAENMEAVKPAVSPCRLFVKWLVVSVAYAGMLMVLLGVRSDISLALHSPVFVAEIVLLFCIVVTCGMSAVVLSFPDLYQKQWWLFTPIVPLVLFVMIIAWGWIHEDPATTAVPLHGIECLLCIAMYSALPAFFMMMIVSRHASTHPKLAGSIALLTSSGIGCLALRLSEETDSMCHLVTWHYLPMIGFALLGVWLGKKMLKW